MTYAEMASKILELMPNAIFDMTSDGEVLIYSGKTTAMMNNVELVIDIPKED
jgi:hypothetical protein